MDNATFHNRKDMIDAITKKGAILKYLPQYSPDLNPIEQKWTQAKAIRKKLKYQSIDGLFAEHLEYIKL